MLETDELCESCDILYELFHLVDYLIKDIQHLETETVRTRYELSLYLKNPYDEFLRRDIFSNLAGRYSDNPAYQLYMKLNYNNQDPMDSKEWVNHIWAVAHGAKEETD